MPKFFVAFIRFFVFLSCLIRCLYFGSALAQPPIPAQPADPSQSMPALPVGNLSPPPRPAAPVTASPLPAATPLAAEPATASKTITILADDSLAPVLGDLVQTWVDTLDDPVTVPVLFTTESSIRNNQTKGKKWDIVLSANVQDVTDLTRSGLLVHEGQQTVARNQVVLLGRHPLIRDDDLTWPELMKREWRSLILADTETTQLGRIAKLALSQHNLTTESEYLKKLARPVPTDARVLAALSGTQADAAFVYQTDLVGATLRGYESYPLTSTEAPPVLYTEAANKNCPDPTLAQSFLSFCGGEAAQAIWKKYGYQLP